MKRIASLEAHEQVKALYRFFVSRFAKLGFEKPPALSPVEYANMFRARIAPYAGAQEPGTFDHLTALFVLQEYGACAADEEDLRAMHYLYDRFYYNCRHNMGLLKYGMRHITL